MRCQHQPTRPGALPTPSGALQLPTTHKAAGALAAIANLGSAAQPKSKPGKYERIVRINGRSDIIVRYQTRRCPLPPTPLKISDAPPYKGRTKRLSRFSVDAGRANRRPSRAPGALGPGPDHSVIQSVDGSTPGSHPVTFVGVGVGASVGRSR